MTHAMCDGGDGEDVLALVREALAARDDVVEFDVHESTPASVTVEIETEEEGDTTSRTLYRVTHEPTVEGGGGDEDDHLHWIYLGEVGSEN